MRIEGTVKILVISPGRQLRRVSLNFRVLEEQCNIWFIVFFLKERWTLKLYDLILQTFVHYKNEIDQQQK